MQKPEKASGAIPTPPYPPASQGLVPHQVGSESWQVPPLPCPASRVCPQPSRTPAGPALPRLQDCCPGLDGAGGGQPLGQRTLLLTETPLGGEDQACLTQQLFTAGVAAGAREAPAPRVRACGPQGG